MHSSSRSPKSAALRNLQAFLKGLVEFEALAIGEHGGFAGRHLLGREPAVLPAVDQHRQHARRPALLVDVLRFQELLEQPDLVVDIEDGEVGLQPDQLGVPAQDLHADRMERAEPRHALDHAADDLADAMLHLARRLVGEGDGENFARPGTAEAENVRDAHGEHTRLAGSGAGQHQHRPVQRFDREPLFRIEAGEIGRAASGRGAGARGNAAGGGPRRFGRLDDALQRVSQSVSAVAPDATDSHGENMALESGIYEAARH